MDNNALRQTREMRFLCWHFSDGQEVVLIITPGRRKAVIRTTQTCNGTVCTKSKEKLRGR